MIYLSHRIASRGQNQCDGLAKSMMMMTCKSVRGREAAGGRTDIKALSVSRRGILYNHKVLLILLKTLHFCNLRQSGGQGGGQSMAPSAGNTNIVTTDTLVVVTLYYLTIKSVAGFRRLLLYAQKCVCLLLRLIKPC